jgi:hypothetical protein
MLSACQPDQMSKIALDDVEQKQLIFVGEDNSFSGIATDDISQIDAYVGDELIDQITPDQGVFEVNVTFDEVGFIKLRLIAFTKNSESGELEEATQSIYSFSVIEREVDDGEEEQLPPIDSDSDLAFTVSLVMHNFDAASKVKGLAAKEAIEAIFNSEEFRQRVLHFRYNGAEQFADNKGLSNQEIYDRLMVGAEVLNGVADAQMDIDITLYHSSWFGRHTVGYTTGDSPKIYSNTRFFYNFTPADVAGNWSHEWVHKMGFGHDHNNTAKRPYSVPYAIGYIVRDMARQYALTSNDLM